MGSRERLLFDLNELPAEEDEQTNDVSCVQPQRAIPSSSTRTSDLFATSSGIQQLVNNHAFSHASSVSGFQPFVRPKSAQGSLVFPEQIRAADLSSEVALISKISNGENKKAAPQVILSSSEVQAIEKEEGEWSDAGDSAEAYGSSSMREQSLSGCEKESQEKQLVNVMDHCSPNINAENVFRNDESIKDENSYHTSLGLDVDKNDQKSSNSRNSEGNCKGDISMDGQEEAELVPRQREVKGVEASHALKCANNPGKRPRFDQHKEAMLGKKRSRQTMFLNLEDVKQAGANKPSTPRRQNFPAPVTTRTVKETRAVPPAERIDEKQSQSVNKDSKQVDLSSNEGHTYVESTDPKSESNGDINSSLLGKPRRLNSATDLAAEVHPPSIPRQSSWKQLTDSRPLKNSQLSTRKQALITQSSVDPKLGTKKLPPKKPATAGNQYQDTSVERLLREVTNEKFWHHPEEAELQCVPGRFESVEEYARVFEPLLFEECRAQLYSTWEELTETASRDLHVMVRVKSVERRERGWYDVIVLPSNECKWTFKEGDVAVLSTPRPGTVRFQRNNTSAINNDEELEVSGRVAGTVRRYVPIDTRDPLGAILHFYVGDSYDPNSKVDTDHIVRKLQPRGIWFLTVLGSLATIQREYVALHAFRRLNLQMQNAILQPSPEHFPRYEEQPPAMPECFTPNFVDYLGRTFNTPQLAAIQWAAMHTAAGTSNGMSKKQDPWPFTLVQGPPGTGKTHTVWGMLNVIHLVQYQHYYNALLKKLAPESYKQTSECNSDNICTGSIDEVLQSMDQNLFRTLPKLCPKPRMLVCAPSNAATDELLARVLDRGFIDGEMKVYRPDVARVGVDTQTRGAQAVSVERRTEQLLAKTRDEIYGWMHQLRGREAQLSQQMACLQRDLNVAAAAGRAQGSVGVDPDILLARDQNRDSLLQSLAAVVENRDKVLVEISRLFILEGKFRAGVNFNLEDARANLEASFANEAEIVFTTVSSSGRKLFSRLSHGFDMVVIDEAAQASEVGVLPPLSLGAARCVLVGDPQQLPATVISKAAGTLLYSRSLFERFQQAGCPTMLLSVQYRMHPQIRDFPSRYFYQGRLTDSESVANLPDEIYYKDPLLRPYMFYDITHGRESQRGGSVSYQNIHEAQFCLRLYERLQKTLKSLGMGKVSVGIITPYKLQLKCLQREFENVLNSEEGKDIYINTVDAFQGQERDVIIMSCVRASNHGVGFVADIRRMNVALTRARRALWVMGNASSLVKSDDWSALIADAKARNCYLDMDSLPKDFLVPKDPGYAPLPGKVSSNFRGLRSGPRHRSFDIRMESRPGTPSEDDEKSNASLSKNGNYQPSKPPMENYLDDIDPSGDKSRDALQFGIQKQQSSTGIAAKRDL
ncbi:P-loop containing nucleoside triphosphate hydrolases superfamily protein [Actinidia rufa]|uniref:P-loop containing nucleoside triphosphate hydrolases superfamily protein n=1 Tax=Actinidia rufa TaxID=165716 RepID=A0A7J0EHY9_9ERIC|nr:P-loop containing nucleoside triphosphate hydrolases superfamily protein [Actinidia rufa]